MRTFLFRWQFCDGDDADSSNEVRAWEGAHGDICLAVATRAPSGARQLGSSDLWSADTADPNVVFGSARAAIEHLAEADGAVLVEAACRCGSGGDCD